MFKDNIKTGTQIIIQDNRIQEEYLGVIQRASETDFTFLDITEEHREVTITYNKDKHIQRDKALHFLVEESNGVIYPAGFNKGEIWLTIYIKEM